MTSPKELVGSWWLWVPQELVKTGRGMKGKGGKTSTGKG